MQASPNSLALYSLPLFLVFFVAVWGLACFGGSVLSGWHRLSGRFFAESEPCGEVRVAGPFFYSVYMCFWCHYSSVVRMTAASDALYLSVLLIFRIGHPPLRVPWDEIKFGRTRFLWLRFVVLTLGSQEQIPMRISERMARNLGILDRVPE